MSLVTLISYSLMLIYDDNRFSHLAASVQHFLACSVEVGNVMLWFDSAYLASFLPECLTYLLYI